MRRRPAYCRNVGKPLTKAPKLFLRDTGLLHHLLNNGSAEELDAHPARGASWEGFVAEDILRRERVARPGSQGCFWRTLTGAEIDPLLDRGDARVAIEIKPGRGGAPPLRVLREALPDVGGAARLDRRSGAGHGAVRARNRADRVQRGGRRHAVTRPVPSRIRASRPSGRSSSGAKPPQWRFLRCGLRRERVAACPARPFRKGARRDRRGGGRH